MLQFVSYSLYSLYETNHLNTYVLRNRVDVRGFHKFLPAWKQQKHAQSIVIDWNS